MTRGRVSTINEVNKTARVIIAELNNRVTAELTIAHYVGKLNINDVVVIEFFDESLSEGMIIGNLSNNVGQGSVNDNTTYTHTQLSSSDVWTIDHNLNRRPSVTIVDSAGTQVMGDIEYIDDNKIIARFTASFAGYAYMN